MTVKATYVSVWDGGLEVRTPCEYTLDTKQVENIEKTDIQGLEILNEEYIQLPGGVIVKDFEDGGRIIIDGQWIR